MYKQIMQQKTLNLKFFLSKNTTLKTIMWKKKHKKTKEVVCGTSRLP